MRQNIYDDPTFFERYMAYRRNPLCLNNTVEQPALLASLPDLRGRRVLDIGCGDGSFCSAALKLGAASVVGLDISVRMCNEAKRNLNRTPTRIINSAIEDYNEGGTYDVIISSLALHYVSDYVGTLKKVFHWLSYDGAFVFSVNHPVYTSDLKHVPDFGSGCEMELTLNRYHEEGVRPHYWFVDGVMKYHRRIQTYIGGLVQEGFRLRKVLEPQPHMGLNESIPELCVASRTPIFVVIAAEKTSPTSLRDVRS